MSLVFNAGREMRYDVLGIGIKGACPKPARVLMTMSVRIAGGTMTTKPVRGITIKDGKVKLKMHYRDASHAIRSKKSTKQRVVRKSKP